MRLAPLTLAGLVAALPAADLACSSDDGQTITDPGTWLETYAGELCAKVFACKADYPTPAEFEARWGVDLAACQARFPTAAEARASVSSGKATFDAGSGRDCLATLGYDSLTCPEFWTATDPSVCAQVLVGTVGAGGACTSPVDCVAGLSCSAQTCQRP